jgi:hypothetical protein
MRGWQSLPSCSPSAPASVEQVNQALAASWGELRVSLSLRDGGVSHPVLEDAHRNSERVTSKAMSQDVRTNCFKAGRSSQSM